MSQSCPWSLTCRYHRREWRPWYQRAVPGHSPAGITGGSGGRAYHRAVPGHSPAGITGGSGGRVYHRAVPGHSPAGITGGSGGRAIRELSLVTHLQLSQEGVETVPITELSLVTHLQVSQEGVEAVASESCPWSLTCSYHRREWRPCYQRAVPGHSPAAITGGSGDRAYHRAVPGHSPAGITGGSGGRGIRELSLVTHLQVSQEGVEAVLSESCPWSLTCSYHRREWRPCYQRAVPGHSPAAITGGSGGRAYHRAVPGHSPAAITGGSGGRAIRELSLVTHLQVSQEGVEAVLSESCPWSLTCRYHRREWRPCYQRAVPGHSPAAITGGSGGRAYHRAVPGHSPAGITGGSGGRAIRELSLVTHLQVSQEGVSLTGRAYHRAVPGHSPAAITGGSGGRAIRELSLVTHLQVSQEGVEAVLSESCPWSLTCRYHRREWRPCYQRAVPGHSPAAITGGSGGRAIRELSLVTHLQVSQEGVEAVLSESCPWSLTCRYHRREWRPCYQRAVPGHSPAAITGGSGGRAYHRAVPGHSPAAITGGSGGRAIRELSLVTHLQVSQEGVEAVLITELSLVTHLQVSQEGVEAVLSESCPWSLTCRYRRREWRPCYQRAVPGHSPAGITGGSGGRAIRELSLVTHLQVSQEGVEAVLSESCPWSLTCRYHRREWRPWCHSADTPRDPHNAAGIPLACASGRVPP